MKRLIPFLIIAAAMLASAWMLRGQPAYEAMSVSVGCAALAPMLGSRRCGCGTRGC